jgi:hypothetical protein
VRAASKLLAVPLARTPRCEADHPAPPVGIGWHASPTADHADLHVAIVDVPRLLWGIRIAAARQCRHGFLDMFKDGPRTNGVGVGACRKPACLDLAQGRSCGEVSLFIHGRDEPQPQMGLVGVEGK